MSSNIIGKVGTVLLVLGAAFSTSSTVAAKEMEMQSRCLSDITLTPIDNSEIDSAEINDKLVGAWGVKTPNEKLAIRLEMSTSGNNCIQDIVLVPEEDTNAQAAVLNYKRVGGWTPDEFGSQGVGNDKNSGPYFQGSVGLYVKDSLGNKAYSSYVITDLQLVATNKDGRASPTDGYEHIGMWDVTDAVSAKGKDTVGTQMMSLQIKRSCYGPEKAGWNKCRVIENPRITILGSEKTSDKAMNAVETVYARMTQELGTKYPKEKLNDYSVYLTNGESLEELRKLWVVNTLWDKDEEFDRLRGGTSQNFLWISEQMICKKGVATYNQGVENQLYDAKWTKEDSERRTFDQVVHEFAHAIDKRNNLGVRIEGIYGPSAEIAVAEEIAAAEAAFTEESGDLKEAGSKTAVDMVGSGDGRSSEEFAWEVQYAFGTPNRPGNATQRPEAKVLMDEIFTPNLNASSAFDCGPYLAD